MSTPSILFVDDEERVLKSLSRMFRREGYDLHTAGGGEEALDLLQGGLKPSVIISDQRMPGMYGSEFLEKSKETAPDAVRILLTGFSEVDAAVDAVNRGGIFRYMNKPWDADELKLTVVEAIKKYDLVAENKRLLHELKDKNDQLEDMNQNLEEMVEKRTRALRQTYDQLQSRVEELEGHDRIQKHLLEIHTLEETMVTILGVIVEVVGVDAAVVHLDRDGELQAVAAIGTTGGDGRVPDHRLPELKDRPVYSRVLAKAVESGDASRYKAQSVMKGEAGVDLPAFAVIPIKTEEETMGVIEVDRRRQSEAILEREVQTIQSFAVQAAIAIRDSQMRSNLPNLEASLDDLLDGLTSE